MASPDTGTSVLRVHSLDEFLSFESEIVERIRAFPKGGELLILDPQRLLRDIQVELTPEAIPEIRLRHPQFFRTTGGEHAYDAVAKSQPGAKTSVTIRGLFPKERV